MTLIGDNCSVNKRLASNCGLHLVGCASQRLNLAVKARLAKRKSLVEKIHKLMKKPKNGLPEAKFRQLTNLSAVNRKKT